MRRSVLSIVAFALASSCLPVWSQQAFNVPLRINMGGAQTTDSRGRVWLGDGPGAGDPLNIRPNDLCGTNWVERWCAPIPDSLTELGFDPVSVDDAYILSTIRYDTGDDGVVGLLDDNVDFRIEIPVPQGEYVLNLYFLECCCPQRHAKLEVQDELIDEDVNYLDYPSDPGLAQNGWAGRLSVPGVVVGAEGILRINLLPCFECPRDALNQLDVNALITAIELLGGEDCDGLGLDLNCTYNRDTQEVEATWSALPSADGYRLLKNGVELATLDGTETSYFDSDPSSGGPTAAYRLEALDGGIAFTSCRCSLQTYICASDLICIVDQDAREVALSWTEGIGLDVTGYEVRRNGTVIATLPGTATTYEDSPTDRSVTYSVTPITDPEGRCQAMACSAALEQNPFPIPLRINMGGRQVVDSKGNVWLGDGPGNGDPLGIRPDDLGGTNFIENWCAPSADTLTKFGLSPASAEDVYIMSTIRWDIGNDGVDFYVELPVPDGSYTLNLYFNECTSPTRHFKVELQGEIVDEDVNYTDYASPSGTGKLGRLSFTPVDVVDGLIRIGFLPCPDCVGVGDLNPIVNAIEIVADPCLDPDFRQCPGSLSCALNPLLKRVTGSWAAPLCFEPTGYELRRNGDLIATLPATATSFTDNFDGRAATYEITTLVPVGEVACVPMSCQVINTQVDFGIPLRINMGGPFATDSKGQKWLGDGATSGDPLGIRVEDLGGTNTILDWCPYLAVAGKDSLGALGYDPADPGDRAIFGSLRWDVADDGPGGPTDPADLDPSNDIIFRLELPIPNGTYDLNLYFTECCCLNRHFKVEIQDTIVDEDVSYLEYFSGVTKVGRTGRLTVEGVSVPSGILSIAFLPCYECPFDPFAVLDMNPIISAIEVLPGEGVVGACPRDLISTIDGLTGEVTGSWAPGENVSITGYDVYRNGEKIQTLSAGATSFSDSPPCDRALDYEIVVLSEDPAFPCPGHSLRQTLFQMECPFTTPLRINMGGMEMYDSIGNLWLGDGPGAGDPLEIRPDDLGGAVSAENWEIAKFQPDSLIPLGFDPDHPGDRYIFNTIRYDDGAVAPDFLIEIPLANGEYTVNLYFTESFRFDRHFKLSLEGVIVEEDLSAEDFSGGLPQLGITARLSYPGTVVDDGALSIGLLPCLDCLLVADVNAIIDGIEILGVASGTTKFHRGDANADGQINITDGIYILNYLFLGGPTPTCIEAANPNDDASVNITDGIYVLNYLFLGGPAPAAPGAPGTGPCGEDPGGANGDLGCEAYDPSKC